jgi:drug/metabolite transporter (DMT)-like permease
MSFLLILPFALTEGPAIFRTQRLREHVSRGVCSSVAMMWGFYPLTHLALAEATAIGFTKPLFLIVLAALIGGSFTDPSESFGRLLWTAGR